MFTSETLQLGVAVDVLTLAFVCLQGSICEISGAGVGF